MYECILTNNSEKVKKIVQEYFYIRIEIDKSVISTPHEQEEEYFFL